ncbi:ankyrin repeat domain-containing protein 29 isoform X1 [Stegostoma tigrinum]|uniref:ankyrin repeat domain-containing protein 29 isoform X1 n=1 Tax=Stegostoma tigrinum TaxID=3053191 RepID=UPI00202B6130|nr:ankyrin repeat domain-containing protein 29 isoform X1 [Stegostoma tigrinum]
MYLDRLAGGSGSWSSHQFTVEVQSRPARTVLSASGCGRNLGPLCDVQREMPLANAVFWTARKGNVTLLRLLLNSGRMDADCKDSLGTTALMVASYCNHKDCVRELILQGADINLQRESGSTALYFAAQQGNDTIVKFLLEYGASTELATKDGATPLSIASQNGHVKVVEILLNRRCNVNIQLKDGATSLFLAAQGGHLNVINMLLASGAKIDQPRQDLTTPLWIAAQMGYNDVVKLLLQWGAHSDTARKDGSTPLFKAAYKGFIEVVRELLACSPSLGILKNGTTALHAAVLGGNVKTVGLLIDSGADPNLRNTAEELPADLTRNDRLIQQLQSKQKRGES